MEHAQSIDLKLSERLRDKEFRKSFFLAEASARIAAQIIALRKKRDLNQSELAALTGTGQPAISRAERADYNNWSFNTLRSIADALDARIRVTIEPAEEVLWEYAAQQNADPLPRGPTSEGENSGTAELNKRIGGVSNPRPASMQLA